MRKEFFETVSPHGYRLAEEACPWAAMIVPVEGGYMCFESNDDYVTWSNQV